MREKFTGMCVCGHDFDDHHHGCILNPQALIDDRQAFRNVDGIFGEECEATQFEGRFTPDVTIHRSDGSVQHIHYDKMCECGTYWDKGWGKNGERE